MRIHQVAGVLAAAAVAGGLLAGCGSKTNPSLATALPAARSAPARQSVDHLNGIPVMRAQQPGQHLFGHLQRNPVPGRNPQLDQRHEPPVDQVLGDPRPHAPADAGRAGRTPGAPPSSP